MDNFVQCNSYPVPANIKRNSRGTRVAQKYTTFLEPASYMSRASPPLPPVSTTLAKLVAKFTAGVVYTGGAP
jgi:hypothetical protein